MQPDSMTGKVPTNMNRRITATILDYFICFTIYSMFIRLFGTHNELGEVILKAPLNFAVVLIWFSYFVLTEYLFGRTLAHYLLNLKVISLSGTKLTFLQALKRRLLDIIDLFSMV